MNPQSLPVDFAAEPDCVVDADLAGQENQRPGSLMVPAEYLETVITR